MGLNGISGYGAADAYTAYKGSDKAEKTTDKKAEENGAIYESSSDKKAQTKYKPDANLIAKLKADSNERVSQLRGIVEQLMSKQGSAIGKADNMWKVLAGGNFTVDAATKTQAQKDIAEDGYWGVNQTSDRILDFAKALTGGDPKKIDEMKSAFEKGFRAATKSWGKSLPDISSRTYDSVMGKFDTWKQEAAEK